MAGDGGLLRFGSACGAPLHRRAACTALVPPVWLVLTAPPPTPLPCFYSVAGLEGEISKLLAAARAVQQQYAIRSADSGRTAGEPAVDQAAAEQQQAGGDVAMQEAGQI